MVFCETLAAIDFEGELSMVEDSVEVGSCAERDRGGTGIEDNVEEDDSVVVAKAELGNAEIMPARDRLDKGDEVESSVPLVLEVSVRISTVGIVYPTADFHLNYEHCTLCRI